MALTGKIGGDFELAPAGVHKARCFKVIDLGSKHDDKWNKMIHKITFAFEIPSALVEATGEPFIIYAQFTLSMHEKGYLRPFLESWRGKNFTDDQAEEFDIVDVLGVPATINIIHNDGYANVKTIMPLAEEDAPLAVNEPLSLVLNKEDFSEEVFNNLSDNMKEKIVQTPEYKLLYEQDTDIE